MARLFPISIVILLCAAVASAGPIPPPSPGLVPGKEYSNFFDHSMAAGFPFDPGQNIWWDGLGAAGDTFDYAPPLPGTDIVEVDALAHIRDAFYWSVSHADGTTMVASFTGVADIHYTDNGPPPPHGTAPRIGRWATGPVDINSARPPDDVDGLELWGPSGPGGDDADMFSLRTDVDPFGGPKISVWSYNVSFGAVAPYISAAAIAGAIGYPDFEEAIDLDAMMVYDEADEPGTSASFGPGDSIMFSIAPIPGTPIDGGEIWVWDFGGPAGFLVHGTEVWDSAHDVTGHFFPGAPGGAYENINALEAIPEPATLTLLALAGLALRRRR